MRRRLGLATLVVSTVISSLGFASAGALSQELPIDSGVKLTVSRGVIDESSASNNLYAPDTWIKVYSQTRTDRNIVFTFDASTCGGTKEFYVYETTVADEDINASSERSEGTKAPCGSSTKTVTVRASDFPTSKSARHANYYVALINVHMQGGGTPAPSGSNGPLSTFTARAGSSNVGLGYWGLYGQSGFPDSVTNGSYLRPNADYATWHVTALLGRPSSSAEDNYTLRFKPNCDFFGGASSRDIWLKWFDDDKGTGYEGVNMRFRVYEADQGASGLGTLIKTVNTLNYPTDGFGGGGDPGRERLTVRPYKKYTWVWENVARTNGIAIWLPFDTANYSENCPSASWELDNESVKNPGIGTYSNSGSVATRQGSAQGAFQAARFYHQVRNLDSSENTAPNDQHQSRIHFTVSRGNSASDRWYSLCDDQLYDARTDAYCSKGPLHSRSLGVGAAYTLDDNPPDPRVSVARSGHLDYLIYGTSGNRAPVAYGGRCSSNAPSSPPSAAWEGNPLNGHCVWFDPDGGGSIPAGWRWNRGDQYCERVRTTDTWRMVDGTPSTGSAYSNSKCLHLRVTPDPDPCEAADWSVGAASYLDQSSGPGSGNPGDAWVDDTFTAYYGYWKGSGRAETTGAVNFWHNGAYQGQQVLGTYSPAHNLGPFGPQHGGQSFSSTMTYSPTNGYTNCTTGGSGQQGPHWVYVPWYYHLTQSSTVTGGATAQQGEPIATSANVTLPTRDDGFGLLPSDDETGGRRQHTYTQPTNWRIVEFRTSDPAGAAAAVPQNTEGNSGPCADLASRGIPGFAGCNGGVAGGTETFTPGTSRRPDGSTVAMTYTRPGQIDPIGTNICYLAAVNRPTHHPANAWRYSVPQCKTIVKSPKVQFRNGDISVGRRPLGVGGTPCGPVTTTAGIQTTSAPAAVTAVEPDPNRRYLYGSWVEYGAFAPGSINGFGSSAEQAGSMPTAKRLTFTNENSALLGRYDFTARCLSNFFTEVSTNAGEFTALPTPTANPGNLNLNTAFPNPAEDRTGYVASGTDVVINPPSLPNTYTYFTGRDIVIYAKKDEPTCSVTSAGNLTINADIEYRKTGYSSIKELPRIVLLADCNITIANSVTRIDASLVAGDAIRTCTAIARNHGVCNARLRVTGQIQASRLLLWRTGGADLTNPVDAQIPAEAFDMAPDQILAGSTRGTTQAVPKPAYELNLPPRY